MKAYIKSGFGIILVIVLFQQHSRALANDVVKLNPRTQWGVWEGWGVSLCWWAKIFGQRDDIADILFSNKYTPLNGQSLPGLGMNIARYNAGACSTNSIGDSRMQVSPKIHPSRQIDGFWLNGDSVETNSSSWDWTVDSNQRAMLQKARDRGANLFELFSNSPMWWMCANHNPSGADKGANDNLPSTNDLQHAQYMAVVARYARDHWGIAFDSVDPFNEPAANWWSATGTQEGCHFGAERQGAVLLALRSELNRRGLQSTTISASDENTYDDALRTWNHLGSAAQASVGRINVHGYQQAHGKRDLLYKASAGKRLWNSEYGESDASGILLAKNLNLDFHHLHMTAWCYWQPLDGGGWGLISSNLRNNRIGRANSKYFVLAHYTRHIRPGMTILDCAEPNSVAAFDAARHKLVIVTAHFGSQTNITFDLSNFSTANSQIQQWVTDTGAGDKYKPGDPVGITNQSFTLSIGSNSIQTAEISNISIR